MINVAVADDHALVREGLLRILREQKNMRVVGEAADGAEAVDLVRKKSPDVILLDISMPRMDGIEATSHITAESQTRVLILTIHTDEQYAIRALRAGAHGFIRKHAHSEQLITAVETIHRGERYVPPDLAEHLAERLFYGEERSTLELTKREFEVMERLAMGLTNREVARQLSISVKTVDSHRSNVLKKLRLRNNADLTRYAIRAGFIQA